MKKILFLVSILFSSPLFSQSYDLDSFIKEYKTRYPEYSERIGRVITFLKDNVSIKPGDRSFYRINSWTGSFSSSQLEGYGSLSSYTSELDRLPSKKVGMFFIKVKQPVYSYKASLLSASDNWNLYGALMKSEKEKSVRLTDIFNFSNSINIKGRFFNDFSVVNNEYKTFPGDLFIFVPLTLQQQEILEDILFETIPRGELIELLNNERFLKLYSDYEKRRDAKNYLASQLGVESNYSSHDLINELLNKINEQTSEDKLPKKLIEQFFTDQVIELMKHSGNGDAAYLQNIALLMNDIKLVQEQMPLVNVKLDEIKQKILERNSTLVK